MHDLNLVETSAWKAQNNKITNWNASTSTLGIPVNDDRASIPDLRTLVAQHTADQEEKQEQRDSLLSKAQRVSPTDVL